MKLIVWLGNPGKQYSKNRHNIWRIIMDQLSEDLGWTSFLEQKKFDGEVASGMLGKRQCLLLKPQTFMNNSGRSISKLVNFYELDPEMDVLVIHDDIDLAFGKMKLKFWWSNWWHNGIRDMENKLGTNRFWRLKLWVWRPENPHIDIADYVLGNFNDEEAHFRSYQNKHILDKMLEWGKNTWGKKISR